MMALGSTMLAMPLSWLWDAGDAAAAVDRQSAERNKDVLFMRVSYLTTNEGTYPDFIIGALW